MFVQGSCRVLGVDVDQTELGVEVASEEVEVAHVRIEVVQLV